MSTTTTTAKEDTDESKLRASQCLNDPISELVPRVDRLDRNRVVALAGGRTQNQLDSEERGQ